MRINDSEYKAIEEYFEKLKKYEDAVNTSKTNPNIFIPEIPNCNFSDIQIRMYELLKAKIPINRFS